MELGNTKGAAPSIRQSATPSLTRDALSELEPDPKLDLAWLQSRCRHSTARSSGLLMSVLNAWLPH